MIAWPCMLGQDVIMTVACDRGTSGQTRNFRADEKQRGGTFNLLFCPCFQPMGWCHPHTRWVFHIQLIFFVKEEVLHQSPR